MADEIKEAPTQEPQVEKPTTDQKNDQPSFKEQIEKGIAPEIKSEEGNASPQDQPQEAGESAEETFLTDKTKINPQELPDELKSIYNSMLSDYKQKTKEIAELRGKVSQESKDIAIQEALENLDYEQFETLTKHPSFVKNLTDYIQKNNNAQSVDEGSSESNLDLDELTDTERMLYEQNQQLKKSVDEMKGYFEEINKSNLEASIASQDANLRSKYGNLYDPEAINSEIQAYQSGKKTLTRETFFKAMDYERAIKRAYEWGRKDSYEGNNDKQDASMLSNLIGSGENAYEIPKKQPKQNINDFFVKLAENAKKNISQGKRSPFVRFER